MASFTTGPDAAAAQDPRDRVRAMLTRLSRTGELPTLPPAAVAALSIARNPESGVDELCRVVRRDVGLAARILRVANSAAYARRVPAQTLVDAVLTLGLRKTCDLLVAAHARRVFAVAPAHAEGLWNHALASALVADELLRRATRREAHLAFLPALFHDVGRIAFYLATTDPRADEPSDLPASVEKLEAERARYGFDHAEAGAILTEDWGLASDQVEAIRWHHQPAQAERGQGLAAVLQVADAAAHAIGFGDGSGAPLDAVCPAVGRDVAEVTAIAEAVRPTVVLHQTLLR